MKLELPVIESCVEPKCGACCMDMGAFPMQLLGKKEAARKAVGNAFLQAMDEHGVDFVGDPMGLGMKPLPGALLAELVANFERFEREGWPKDNSPCIWLDLETRQCKHYEYRPLACAQAVERGDARCRGARREQGIDRPAKRFRLKRGKLVEVQADSC